MTITLQPGHEQLIAEVLRSGAYHDANFTLSFRAQRGICLLLPGPPAVDYLALPASTPSKLLR
ncbi:MAG TPA: hypothetical protein VMI06_02155 [Terriglobia bacterium]|nr:hypothetical protein [Terriglobia bacterium]